MSDLRRKVLARPTASGPGPNMSRGRGAPDYSPLTWHKFYGDQHKVQIEVTNRDNTNLDVIAEYHVYSLYTKDHARKVSYDHDPVVILLHGCGYSGLTWGEAADEADKYMEGVQMFAIDLREHGLTTSTDDYNLDFEVLKTDVLQVLNKLQLAPHPLVFVGHSMGGALAIRLAEHIEQNSVNVKVAALFIIDIVEGSAVEALPSMRNIIKSRPAGFESVEKAIEWSLKSGQVRSQLSARFSVPGQLKKIEARDAKIEEDTNSIVNSLKSLASGGSLDKENVIMEEDEDAESREPTGSDSSEAPRVPGVSYATMAAGNFKRPEVMKYKWRVDLMRTEPYWMGWFQGMSQRFLNVKCPKYLLLANVDRLDKELTIAQMQGRFQMSCIHGVGHAVQEDKPDQVGIALATFLLRNKFARAKPGAKQLAPGMIM